MDWNTLLYSHEYFWVEQFLLFFLTFSWKIGTLKKRKLTENKCSNQNEVVIKIKHK